MAVEARKSMPTWLKAIALTGGAFAAKEVFEKMTEKSVDGNVVLITGAGAGIGRLMALKFAKLGARLVLWDINREGVEAVAKEIVAARGEAKSYIVDVTSVDAVNEAAEAVLQEFGRVDILMNNAGVAAGRKLLDNSHERVGLTFGVNTLAHFWTVKAFLPAMIGRNAGHIVTIASASAFVGVSGLADYAASKWAVLGFNESLRMELRKLGKSGVKTTCVCPFYIATELFKGVKSRWPLLLPILQPDYVASQVVTAVRRNRPMLVMPKFVWMTLLARFMLPVSAFDGLMDILGINATMDSFVGRRSMRPGSALPEPQ